MTVSATTDKKSSKGNWKQRLIERRLSDNVKILKVNPLKKLKFFKKSLFYTYFLKKVLKSKNKITYLNLKTLKVFLTKYAKIKNKRKTRISTHQQRQISKAIRRARSIGLIPFTTNVIIKKQLKRRKISTF